MEILKHIVIPNLPIGRQACFGISLCNEQMLKQVQHDKSCG